MKRSITIVFLIAALAASFPILSESQENNIEQQTHSSEANQTIYAPRDYPAPVPPNWEHLIKPGWNKIECDDPKSHDEADFCEQRRMAKAAIDLVWLNVVQIALGVVGATFILLTLMWSRRAANAAVPH